MAFDLCCYYNLIYKSPCTQSHEQQITWLSVRSSMFWQFHWALRRLFFLSYNETWCDLNIMFSAFLCVLFRRTKAAQPYCIHISSADGLLSCRIPPDVITFMWEEQHAQYSISLHEAGETYSTFHEIFTCMIYIQSRLDVPVRETNRSPLKHPSGLCNLFYSFMNII